MPGGIGLKGRGLTQVVLAQFRERRGRSIGQPIATPRQR